LIARSHANQNIAMMNPLLLTIDSTRPLTIHLKSQQGGLYARPSEFLITNSVTAA